MMIKKITKKICKKASKISSKSDHKKEAVKESSTLVSKSAQEKLTSHSAYFYHRKPKTTSASSQVSQSQTSYEGDGDTQAHACKVPPLVPLSEFESDKF